MVLESRIEGEGKPLVILHGFLGMSDNWKTLSGSYAENGYKVHALDMRNHGRSFHDDVFNYNAMAQDVYEYCTNHQLGVINLMGHSMGGKAAMFFAIAYPEKLEKLIIADIGTKYYAPHHQDILAGLKAVDFTKRPSRSEVDDILKNYITDFGTRQFLMKSLYWKSQGQLAFRFNLDVFTDNDKNIGKALPEEAVYDKPALFLRGERSSYIREKDIDGIKKHFPQATVETVKNAGHWLHAENPEDYLSYTLAFLNGS